MMTLRPCTPADAPALALVGTATFLDAYAGFLSGAAILAACRSAHTEQAYAALLAQPQTQAWFAEVSPSTEGTPAPVGYVVLAAPDFTPSTFVRSGDIELKRIYLLSRFQRGGTHSTKLGQAMMDTATTAARVAGYSRMLIGVHGQNHRALAFYRRNGFEEIARRIFQLGESLYDDPVLALEL